MKAVKVVIIGAGSASFGLSSLATLLREPTLRGSTLALVDLNTQGLLLVHQLAERMNRQWDAGMSIESHADRRAALEGADFVACTIEVGPREQLWRQDWELTLRHGLRQPYAENGGPGGFAHTARNMPQILDIARDMEELCPRALFLNLTNPVPRLCRALSKYTAIKAVGLCHQIGYGYGMAGVAMADHLGVEIPPALRGAQTPHSPAEWKPVATFFARVEELIDIKAAGLNHFTWMLDVRDRRTGEDLYPLLKERFLADPVRREPLTRDMLRVTGYLPVPGDTHLCEYLQYTHNPATKPWERYQLPLYDWDAAAQQRDTGWDRIARLAAEGGADLDSLRTVTSEGLYEVIHGVAHDANTYRTAANVPNEGAISNLPAYTVVETPVVISGIGVLPVRLGALPPVVAELCRREAELVELVVDAAVSGDRFTALQALALDPTIDDLDTARTVLDDILETHKVNLPQFHGRWQWGDSGL
jgi:alpha-galactosidase